jgi:hypothetical protein
MTLELVLPLSAAVLLYFLPAIIASVREADDRVALVWLNLLLGWTGIGWLALFLWAMLARRAPMIVRIQDVPASRHADIAARPSEEHRLDRLEPTIQPPSGA